MQINEDINNRFDGSTSSNDSGVIMMDGSIHKNYQNNNKMNNINDNLLIMKKDNNNEKLISNLNSDNQDNHSIDDNISIKNNEIRIEDLDDVSNVSIRNYKITNSQRSSTIYSSSNVSINSINQNNNHNNNNHNNDDDVSTVYDSDSDFIEELGDKLDNNNGIVSIRNAIGLNENELENGRVILDQQITGQNIENNLNMPNGISNNGVNINSLSFSGTNNGVTIGPKFFCQDLVIKQYVQKSPKQQFRKIAVDGNSTSCDGNDNSNYHYDESCADNSIRKNQNGLQQNNTEKPKLFSIRSRATLITGSIILLIIVLGAITFAALEIQKETSSQDDHIIGDGDDSRKHIPVNSTIGDELITADYDPTLKIIEKSEWLGLPAKTALTNLSLPLSKVIICHTVTPVTGCDSQESCSITVQNIQHYHMLYMKPPRFDDIGYNFLVGGDGAIYVGRGWFKMGAHTRGQNDKSIGIAFIGDYNVIKPTPKQINATQMLIEVGVKAKILQDNYKVFGHKQFIVTESPGQYVYAAISKWSHFSVEIFDQ